MSLRQSIAGYLKDFRGMTVQPEQIIIGAGTEYLYGLLIQLLGHEAVYAVENPGYQKIGKIYRNYQVNWTYIDMDDEGVEVSQLEEKKVDIVHISPSHHYPTGIVMPISRRYELLGWASKGEGRYIIEDDYDSELRLGGKPIPTLQSIDISEKVIYMNTFTKTLASTVRISYMILPRPLLEQFYQKLSFYSCTVSNFEQYTLDLFIKEGYFEKHINRLRNYYQNKKNGFLSAIWDSGLHKCVEISGEEAGVHFLMKLKTEKAEENVIELAKAQGIKLSPLSKFYYEKKAGIENTYPKLCQLSYGTEKPYRPSAAHHQGTDHDLGRGTAETVERKRPDLAKTATGDAATPSPHRRITSFSGQQQRHLARLAERKQKRMGREHRQTV